MRAARWNRKARAVRSINPTPATWLNIYIRKMEKIDDNISDAIDTIPNMKDPPALRERRRRGPGKPLSHRDRRRRHRHLRAALSLLQEELRRFRYLNGASAARSRRPLCALAQRHTAVLGFACRQCSDEHHAERVDSAVSGRRRDIMRRPGRPHRYAAAVPWRRRQRIVILEALPQSACISAHRLVGLSPTWRSRWSGSIAPRTQADIVVGADGITRRCAACCWARKTTTLQLHRLS